MKDEQDLLNNKFYIVTNYITQFFMSNLWFCLLISPFIFYLCIYNQYKSKCLMFIFSLTIGPALTTLFSTIGKLEREKDINTTKDFFHFYKLNFFQGILLAAIVNGLISLIYYDMLFFLSKNKIILFYIMVLCLIFIILSALYAYPIISRYNMRILYLLKLSIGLVIKKTYISLSCLAAIIILFWLIRVCRLSLLGLLFGTSILCYCILKIERRTIDSLEELIKNKYKNN